MRINGNWVEENDGIVRPLLRAKIENEKGEFVEAEFLVDTGADHSVLTVDVLQTLELPIIPTLMNLGGVGGAVDSQGVAARLVFRNADNRYITINLECFAFTKTNHLETCILGRDVLNLFAVVLDYREKVVALLGSKNYTLPET